MLGSSRSVRWAEASTSADGGAPQKLSQNPTQTVTAIYASTQDMRSSVKAFHAESAANSPVDVLRPGTNST